MKHYRVMLRDKLDFDRHPEKRVIDVHDYKGIPPALIVAVLQCQFFTWQVIGIEASR